MKTLLPGDDIIVKCKVSEIRKTISGNQYYIIFKTDNIFMQSVLINEDILKTIIVED